VSLNVLHVSSEWMRKGKCRDFEPDIFHPSAGGRNTYEPAKRICGSCPVVNECLAFALANMSDEGDDPATRAIGRFGVWGGTDPAQRQTIAYKQRRYLKVPA
jgi:WhiB family transcriptional regulator, redox-sensing transcriptional regulator